MGTRGIPNRYGGFEQCAQHLTEGLVGRGHSVTVYNSSLHPYRETEWRGARIVRCTDFENRIGTAGQFIYDLLCMLHARKKGYDVILQMGYTSSSIWHWLWPKKARHLVNMDGLEYKRSKYSTLVKMFLKRAEAWATRKADLLIADNPEIEKYLQGKYRNPVKYISYGVTIPQSFKKETLGQFGLVEYQYDLLIARMEPENHVEEIISASSRAGEMRLVVVGGLSTPLAKKVKRSAGKDISFLGPIYDLDVLNDLRHFSRLYFHGHSVGGTNPSLLEAMACGCTIVAHDNPFNRNVLEGNALYFRSVQELENNLMAPPGGDIARQWSAANLGKLRSYHQWGCIVESYEAACYGME